MHAYFKHYSQAQRIGARLVVIDPDLMKPQPKRTSGCRLSPVCDIALALGMINTIMQESGTMLIFLRAHTGAVCIYG